MLLHAGGEVGQKVKLTAEAAMVARWRAADRRIRRVEIAFILLVYFSVVSLTALLILLFWG